MSYSDFRTKQQQKELLRLRQKIRNLQKAIKYLDESFEARLFGAIETVTIGYGSLLNPHPVPLEEKVGKHRNEYEISTAQIICITADELTKKIVLTKPIAAKGSNRRKKQVIEFEGTWGTLENKLTSSRILLCKVNKSTYVNVAFYELNNGVLTCHPAFASVEKVANKLKLNAAYAERFKAVRTGFNQMSSIEKRAVHFF